MNLPPFIEFFSKLRPDHIEKVYDGLSFYIAPQPSDGPVDVETANQLRAVVCDSVAVIALYLLGEYHEWLAGQLSASNPCQTTKE
ncbi:hypothetical protein [Alicyclobacillus acidocaldarius]|uniref:Uncharacterized protein n=1 Tax=Alicyclobacillus acidocaldarius (strain Tc-4-1) TaxID=1048834 RepID=F8ICS7_ALIAT|nr:hypothetical protein [Alicyclobacillus acidocaldarius]AEJ43742.1 hypothetical protein TC41_1824 [Alicyclobacillus acidocaldarius subsp. acidocaldarius Tc-4-1]